MKILYGKGLDDEDDLLFFRDIIQSNIVTGMYSICEAAEALGLHQNIEAQASFQEIMDSDGSDRLDKDLVDHIYTLWQDPAIQQTWQRRANFQIIESCGDFISRVREIARDDYEPSITDILNARARTTGIVEDRFIIKGVEFVIIDVGGQRNERKKWMHCFEDMNATIFVAALSEYDQTLFEDETQNRMVEALEMFNQAINSSWLAEVDVILFLNKMDLFAEKIEHSNIADVPAFSDYNGGENDFDAGVEYFRQKFMGENRFPDKKIYSHVTCATDTKNVSHVFNSCRKIILQKNLQESGMLG